MDLTGPGRRGQHRKEDPMTTLEELLVKAEMDIHRARAGLYDENEGEVTRSVLQLAAVARELEELVTTW